MEAAIISFPPASVSGAVSAVGIVEIIVLFCEG